MKLRRLCLACLSDWTGSGASMCPACHIEHALHQAPKGSWKGKLAPVEWWGPTEKDIRGDDAVTEDSFYTASAIEGDISYRPSWRQNRPSWWPMAVTGD